MPARPDSMLSLPPTPDLYDCDGGVPARDIILVTVPTPAAGVS